MEIIKQIKNVKCWRLFTFFGVNGEASYSYCFLVDDLLQQNDKTRYGYYLENIAT